MIGGMGRPAGGITGGGGNGIMLGRLTSSTIRGSLPWSNGQRSPRTQNPFSVRETEGKILLYVVKKLKTTYTNII